MTLGNLHLTPDLVQAVRDAVDILDVASEYTRLKKAGRRYQGLCPLHKEKTPSFSVDPDQGFYYCFGCGQGGDAIKLHMLLSGDDFPAAIEVLARRYGIPLPSAPQRSRRERDQSAALDSALEEAEKFFAAQLVEYEKPRRYLDERKISDDLRKTFGIGYAPPEWRELIGSLRGKVGIPELEKAGLIARSERRPDEPYDRFRDRLMFPVRNAAGRLVGFGGRTLGDDKAKYINTSETARFQKGQLLYGLDLAKRGLRESRRAILVEGFFDVIGATAAGVEGAVASMGTALTREQCRLLSRFSDEVVVAYDGDSAGEKASRRGLSLLLAEGLAVMRPDMGVGDDPDSIRLERGPEVLVEMIADAPDAVTLEIDRLTPPGTSRDPRAQARSASALVELLKPIPDTVLRYGYSKQAADRLGLPVGLLLDRLKLRKDRDSPAREPRKEASPVRTLEEKTLQLLLAGGENLPPIEQLPHPEAFLNDACRNIYTAFLALYGSGEGGAPEPREVLARLPNEGESVDRIARLLLEESVGSDPRELEGSVYRLSRRWQQQRSRELAAQIGEAQRAGDQDLLKRLLEEKSALSRQLHSQPPVS
jgi:DNA primase